MTHKTVPVEPTAVDLLIKAMRFGYPLKNNDAYKKLKGMLEAAPPSPVTELEVMLANAATQAESDLTWVEKQAKGSNFQSSLILLHQALAAYEAKKEGK